MSLRTWCGWPTAVSAAIAVGLLFALIALNRGGELPLLVVQLDLLVLASGTAYLLDDVAKSVTDVVPTSLLRRRVAIVAQGLAVVGAGWSIMLGLGNWLTPTTPLAFLSCELAGVSCVAVAMASVASLVGEDEPGNLVAPALALIFIATLIVQRMIDVSILATSTGDPTNSGWWALASAIAVLIFVRSSRRGWRPRRSPEAVSEGSEEWIASQQ